MLIRVHFARYGAAVSLMALAAALTYAFAVAQEPPGPNPSVHELRLSRSIVPGGWAPVIGIVALDRKSAAGTLVHLFSADPATARVPPTVLVPTDRMSAPFPITTFHVSSPRAVAIRATAGAMKEAELTVRPYAVADIELDPPKLTGGESGTGIVVLDARAERDFEVTLTCDDPAVTITPSVLHVPKGQDREVFDIDAGPVPAPRIAKLFASTAGWKHSTDLRLTLPPRSAR